jgi:hypothetical protein
MAGFDNGNAGKDLEIPDSYEVLPMIAKTPLVALIDDLFVFL